jgi:uncharacterized protein (UPF0332 family)
MGDFETCLEMGSLVQVTYPTEMACAHELQLAQEDLGTAEVLLEHVLYRNTISTAYFAMFHAARALVLSQGYSERSHRCLAVAFEHLYGGSTRGAELAQALHRARSLREQADYTGIATKKSAVDTLKVANRFVETAARELVAARKEAEQDPQ